MNISSNLNQDKLYSQLKRIFRSQSKSPSSSSSSSLSARRSVQENSGAINWSILLPVAGLIGAGAYLGLRVSSRDIFKHLKRDHRIAALLIALLEKTEEDDVNLRRKLFKKLKNALEAHSHSEEQAVYRRLQVKSDASDLMARSYSEHKEIERMLNQLYKLSPSKPEWKGRLIELKGLIERHVQIEESSVFDKIRNDFNDDELKEMAREMKNMEHAEKARLSQAV